MGETQLTAAIEQANEAFVMFHAYVSKIDEANMLAPEVVGIWSGKDIVVHIASWEENGVQLIDQAESGQEQVWIPEGYTGDEWNEKTVADHADMPLNDALDFWRTAHTAFVNAAETAEGNHADLLLNLTSKHYALHYSDFQVIRPFKPLSDNERSELLTTMDAAHKTFQELISGIGDADLLRENTVGTWSGKDLIAHLGHWQDAARHMTSELEAGRPGLWPYESGNDIDAWNEERVAATRAQSLMEVKNAQQEAYDNLRTAIANSPKATKSAGIGGTEFHYDIHHEDFEGVGHE